MSQEGRVDAGVAESQRLAVNLDGTVPEGSDQVIGGVLQGEQVASVLPVAEVRDRDERLNGAVAGACAVSGQRGVDAGHSLFDGDDGVGDGQRQVLVGVDAQLGGRFEHVT
jgi:hypothetical protein